MRNLAMEFCERLKRGDFAVDIGASQGTYALPMAGAVGQTGRILAIEPHPKNLEMLRKIAETVPWLRVVNGACLDRDGPVTLYCCGSSNNGTHSLRAENRLEPAGDVTVTGYRLDDLVADWPHLEAIKIDAQGAEGLIVRGAEQTLRKFKPLVLVEIWPPGLRAFGWTVEQLEAALNEAGLVKEREFGPSLEELRRNNRHSSADWLFAPAP